MELAIWPNPRIHAHPIQSFQLGRHANIMSKKGKITSLTLDYSPPLISDDLHDYTDDVIFSLLGDLYNQKYGLPDHHPTTGPMDSPGARMRNDIIAWLQQEM